MESTETVIRPHPDERRKGRVQGVPLKMADGREWFLAEGGIAPAIAAVRDRIFDHLTIRQAVRIADAFEAAWSLLSANYELTSDEAAELLFGADQGELVEATITALFGPERPRRGWTEWATTALRANNLDPTRIPSSELHGVLAHLVISGRAAAQDQFVGSAIHASKRSKLGGP